MRRPRFSKPLHWIMCFMFGLAFALSIKAAVHVYPNSLWIVFAMIAFLTFLFWLFIDVRPLD